jgi:hypothetical protein
MTRQEELVWAAAWALSMRDTRGADDPYRATIAKERAHEAVDELRTEADLDSIQGSDAEADVLLRQMAGEPDCFMPRRRWTSRWRSRSSTRCTCRWWAPRGWSAASCAS